MAERIWNVGGKPVVLAHRGGGNEAPENSLAAFSNMDRLGFRYVETDAHATKDGAVILFHDATLSRTTAAEGRIRDYTWQRLRKITDPSGNPPVRLDLVLESFPNLVLNIDAKSEDVISPLVRTLTAHGAQRRVSLASFSEKRLRRLRKMLPGVCTSLGQSAVVFLTLAANIPVFMRVLERLRLLRRFIPLPEDGAQAVQVPVRFWKIRVVSGRFVGFCHRLGFAVHVWTVNDPREMRMLLELGVDALITDEPSRARRIIDGFWAEKTAAKENGKNTRRGRAENPGADAE